MSWTSVHNSSGTLWALIPWIYFHFHCIIIRDLIHVIPECASGFLYFLHFKSGFCNELQWSPSLFLLTVYSFSIFSCKEYNNQSGFDIDHLVMSMCRVISWLFEEGVCYDQCVLLTKLLTFIPLHFVLQGQTCLLLQVISWLTTFAFQFPMMKMTSFIGVSSRRSCRSS